MECKDVFRKRLVISPERFRVIDYPRRPVAVFNPGAVLVKDEVHIFPRLVFDYYKYTSSIGHFKISVQELLEGKLPSVIDVEIIMWPKSREDLLGVEDPRAHLVNDEIWILYTAKGFDSSTDDRKDYLGFAIYDFRKIERIGYFSIDLGKEKFYPKSNKDSTFLEIEKSKARILTRPHIDSSLSLWVGEADLDDLVIRNLRVVKSPSTHEEKLGWSTNSVKLDGKWLVGWHSVMRKDLSYRNGFAVVEKDEFEFTDHRLCPKGLIEEYGDRALVVFGCGLLSTGNDIVWIGGVSDYAIGIFVAGKEDVFG